MARYLLGDSYSTSCSVWTSEGLTYAFGVVFFKQIYLAVLGFSILWDFPHNLFTGWLRMRLIFRMDLEKDVDLGINKGRNTLFHLNN